MQAILEAIAAQLEGHDWKHDGGDFIPHPATWLNGGRWMDEVRPYVEPAPKHGAWWATKETMEAFGRSLTPPLPPGPGEYPREYAERIRAALERAGKPVELPKPTPYTPPAPMGGESVLNPEQQKARRQELLALAGSRKAIVAEQPELEEQE